MKRKSLIGEHSLIAIWIVSACVVSADLVDIDDGVFGALFVLFTIRSHSIELLFWKACEISYRLKWRIWSGRTWCDCAWEFRRNVPHWRVAMRSAWWVKFIYLRRAQAFPSIELHPIEHVTTCEERSISRVGNISWNWQRRRHAVCFWRWEKEKNTNATPTILFQCCVANVTRTRFFSRRREFEHDTTYI